LEREFIKLVENLGGKFIMKCSILSKEKLTLKEKEDSYPNE
jgi:hypothetical protein